MIRSQSDDQIVAKLGLDGPECIPSRDPQPWRCGKCGHRLSFRGWHDGAIAKWEPRAFVGNPIARPDVNPILSAFRANWSSFYKNMSTAAQEADVELKHQEDSGQIIKYTDEQVASARVILERLARLQAVSA